MSLAEEHRLRINELIWEILKEIVQAVQDASASGGSTSAFVANLCMTMIQVQMAMGQSFLESLVAASRKQGIEPVWIGKKGKAVFDVDDERPEERDR